MCGFGGILNFDKKPVSVVQLRNMTSILSHRGPDGEGHFVDKNMGMGHRRLAIIDLSSAGNQPMQSKDGRFILSYNGEIYNFKEIRAELCKAGHSFYSQTDSEVVLNAFVEWGADCVNRFNGMFAFAVWDKKDRNLFLARDRYGIKPLYYIQTENSVVFGSEIKAILASGLYKTVFDKQALFEYINFQNFFSAKTLFKDIQLLSPGHILKINESKICHMTQYWDFNFTEKTLETEKESEEKLKFLLEQSVNRQLVSDTPINSYLSGGLDSSAITAIAAKTNKDMKTFTVGFDLTSASGLELAFDERQQAEHMAYHVGTEHYEIILKAGDMERCLKKLVWHLEEPRLGQCYPNFYAAKLASHFGKVVFSGAGGDELFAGYPWRYYRGNHQTQFDTFFEGYYGKWQRLIPDQDVQQLISPIMAELDLNQPKQVFKNILSTYQGPLAKVEDYINCSLYFEAKTFLQGLLVVEDKLSMAHSLEVRVPFLDNDLVDFAMTLPVSYKLQNLQETSYVNENASPKKIFKSSEGKKILRNSLAGYIPHKVLNQNKQGFSGPDASWFRGESIEYVKSIILDKTSQIYHYLDFNTVNKIALDHFKGVNNHRLFIWSLIYLENFFETFAS